MKDIEQELKGGVMILSDQFKEAKPGSDEQRNLTESIVKLSDEYLRYIKGEDDIFNNDAERQKIYAEVEKLKSSQISNLKDWISQIRPEQAANIIVILAITGATVSMEKTGHILPDRLLKWGMRLFKA